jgi:hypothetical protein
MKTMLLAAAATLSFGIGSAYAGDGEGPSGGYVYPGSIYAGAEVPAQSGPSVATAQNGRAQTHVYVTHSNRGTWLFPPNQNQGGNN